MQHNQSQDRTPQTAAIVSLNPRPRPLMGVFTELRPKDLTFHGVALKSGQKMVMMVLLNHANPKTGHKCFPSIARIAEQAFCKPETVSAHIALLEKVGLIKIERRTGKSNIYYCDEMLIRGLHEMYLQRKNGADFQTNPPEKNRGVEADSKLNPPEKNRGVNQQTPPKKQGGTPPKKPGANSQRNCPAESSLTFGSSTTSVPVCESGASIAKEKPELQNLEKHPMGGETNPHRKPEEHRTGGQMNRADVIAKRGLAAVASGFS